MARGDNSSGHPQPPRARRFSTCNFLGRIKFSLFLCIVIVGVAFASFQFFSHSPLGRLEDFSAQFDQPVNAMMSFVEDNNAAKFEPYYKRLHNFSREDDAKFYGLCPVGLKLGLVFTHLLVDPFQDLMISSALSLKEIGHEFEVVTLEDGPVPSVWRQEGISVTTIETNNGSIKVADWPNYDAVFSNSLEAIINTTAVSTATTMEAFALLIFPAA